MDEITEQGWFRCTCEIKQPRKRIIKGGAVNYGLQCQNCGRFENKGAKFFGFSPPTAMIDESISIKFKERADKHWQNRIKTQQDERDRAKQQWREYYDWYINSAQWRAKRQEVLERDNYVCCGCRKRKATQVHHLTYDHIGQELLWELVSVCDDCHQVVHPHMRVEMVNINWDTFR